MVDSKYPNELDDDVTLIRIDDNIVEIGGDAINGIRSAVFNIEQTLGINPHGSNTDVASRLNQSLNVDGTIKASALSTIGLVTLPITDSMVGNNAGITESKLDLNYSTKILRELIGALRVEHDALNKVVQGDITNLARHVAHPSTFSRHRTSDIDGYLGTYVNYNLQGIINDLDTRIVDHISDPIDAHNASAISFDDTDTFINADEVQTAIEKLDALGVTTLTIHQDEQHSNGILNTQKTFYGSTNHGVTIISSSAINNISAGDKNVAFTSVPSDLAQVLRGDRIDIVIGTETYTRNIDNVNASTGIVYFFRAIPISGVSPTATIYRNIEETTEPSMLKLAIRHDTIPGNLGGSLLQLIHPSAPYLLSNGLDTRKITSTSKYIKIAWATGETIDIDAYQALQTYPVINSTPSIWTPEGLSIALNKIFKSDTYNYPLIAFTHKGEIGIAFDEPDGYVEFRDVSTPSESAWEALGFVGNESDYSVGPRRFYIDGYNFYGIRKIVSASGVTDTSKLIKNIDQDLTAFGVDQTGVVRIKNHPDAGTYVFNSSTSNSITIGSHSGFSTATNVSVEIYSDSFSVSTNTGIHTLYELFMDGYDQDYGELRGVVRVEYIGAGGSTASPENWFNIIEMSRDFPVGTKRINFQNVGSDKVVKMGTPVTSPASSVDVTDPGTTYILPTSDVIGYRFRIYDYNNVDYVDIEIANDGFLTTTTDQAIDLTIYKRASEDKYVQVGQVLHDTNGFKHLSDRRLLGTVGRKDIRNDFSRDYISYPRSLLRGNGVIYGFEVSGSLIVEGGQVLVDGNIYSVSTTGLDIPKDGLISTYNIFVDGDGILQFMKDDQVGSGFTTPSVLEIINSSDKVILAQVDVNSSNTVTDIRDLRRFVNNIDNKIDLVADDEEINGSFSSLQSAFYYIYNSGTTSRRVRVRGTITHNLSNGPLYVPDGVTILGDVRSGSSIITRPNIFIIGSGTTLFAPISGTSITGLCIRDLKIEMDSSAGTSAIIGNSTTSIVDLTLENCLFENIRNSSGFSRIVYSTSLTNTIINNCIFNFDTSIGSVDAYVFYSTTSIDTIHINNSQSTLTSTNDNYFMYISAGTGIVDLYMNNCMINLGSPTSAGSAIKTNILQNSFIINSNISYTSVVSTNIGIEALTLTECQIKGCYFSNINTGILALTNTSNNIISDCGFNELYVSAIILNSDENSIIKNNLITSSDISLSATDGIIKLIDPNKTLVDKNIINITDSSSASGIGILISNTSQDCILSYNILKNSGSNIGLKQAIVFDGGGGTSGGDHIEDSMVGNKVRDFYGNSSDQGIYMENCDGTIVSQNSIINCCAPIKTFNCPNIVVSNNTFTSSDNYTLVSMSHNTTHINIKLVNNNIISTSLSLTNRVVDFQSSRSQVIGNFITTESNTKTHLYINSTLNTLINNNVFRGTVSYTTEAVLELGSVSYYCLITNNDFTATSSSGPMITDGGSKNVDYMNKGQTYNVVLPNGAAVIDSAISGSFSSWITYGGGWVVSSSTYDATYYNLNFYFSTEIVPAGATINNVEVYYNISAGVKGDFQLEWNLSRGFGSLQTTIPIRAASDAQGNGIQEEIVIPSGNNIMQYEDVHAIRLIPQNTVGTIYVLQVRVNYTL